MPKRILQALRELSEELGIRTVTPEYEILLVLLAEPGLSPDELCERSSLSRSGFFHALDRLKHWQFIVCEAGSADRRRKTYRLHPGTADMLKTNLRIFRRSPDTFKLFALRRSDGAAPATDGSDTNRRLPHITCEHQILLCLHLRPGLTTSELERAIWASPTRFHTALRQLGEMGLVVRTSSDEDKRRKRYFIPERVSRAIAQSIEHTLSWLDAIESGDERPAWPQLQSVSAR